MKKHKQNVHQGIKFACDQCNYTCNRIQDLNLHVRSKRQGITYPCDVCDYKATTLVILRSHEKTIHNENYPCSFYKFSSSKPNRLKLHKQNVHKLEEGRARRAKKGKQAGKDRYCTDRTRRSQK